MALGGCAAIPDLTIQYRPVKASVQVAVVHTITCNRDNTLAIVERGATFLPVYSAAEPDKRFQLRLKDLDRFYADVDVKMEFTDDGRLKSINQSSEGQGEALVTSTVGALSALGALGASSALNQPGASGVQLFNKGDASPADNKVGPSAVCQILRSYTFAALDEAAQLSLVQSGELSGSTGANEITLNASTAQEPMLKAFKEKAHLDLSAKVKASLLEHVLQPIAGPSGKVARDEVPLTLQQMGILSIDAFDKTGSVGKSGLPFPRTNEIFVLPIPKAALFGKQTFPLVLAESGRITSIGYGRSSGVPGALNATKELAGARVTENTAKAAVLKAASDLIVEQRRFTNCRLDSSKCQ